MARSELLVWVGSAGVFLSAMLGIVAVFFPFSWLIILSLALGGISGPTAILSARYAAREQQRQFEYLYIRTPEGRLISNVQQQPPPDQKE